MKTHFFDTLVEIAEKELGTQEVGKTNRGPRVDDYQRATNLEPEDYGAWCCAFVCFCVMLAMEASGTPETKGFKRPKTARVLGPLGLDAWSLKQDDTTNTKKKPGRDIQRGDVVTFSFSHTGIAASKPDALGYFETIEGNTNAGGSRTGGKVCRQRRHASLVESRIRFAL